MKILKIELQNINSLKSDLPVTIDFEGDKFQDVGLFAITGATGAGKTTILDAITIALYHNVPRFNDSHVKAGLEDVVSFGADGALARVVFENKGVRYEAHWSMRMTTKTGKRLGNPKEEVRLKNLTEETILAEKKREVQSEIETITQLSYSQFLRSVMLAQGEFAAFLSAKASDKGTLLEQITGEEIYKKIGAALLEKLRQEEKKLEQIESKINNEDLLSEDMIKVLGQERKELAERIALIDKDLKEVEKILNWFNKNTELEETKKDVAEKEEELKHDQEENKEVLQRLNLHEQAEPFKESITELNRIENQIAKLKGESATLTISIDDLSIRLTEANEKEKTKKEDHKLKETENTLWQPKLEEVAKLETSIGELEKVAKKTDKEITDLNILVKDYQEKKAEKKEELELSEIKLADLVTYMEENKDVPEMEKQLTKWSSDLTLRKKHKEQILLEEESIQKDQKENSSLTQKISAAKEILQSEKENLDKTRSELLGIEEQMKGLDMDKILEQQKLSLEQKDFLQELLRLSADYKASITRKKELDKESGELLTKRKKIESGLKEFSDKIIVATESLKDAEKIYEQQLTIKSYEKERLKLKEGEPCVVCGSTTHPLVSEYGKYEPSKALQEVDARKATLEELRENQKFQELAAENISVKITSIAESQTLLNQHISEASEAFISKRSVFDIVDMEAIQEAFDTAIRKLYKMNDDIKLAQGLQKQKDKKDNLLKEETEKLSNTEKQITGLKVKSETLEKGLKEKTSNLEKSRKALSLLESSIHKNLEVFSLAVPDVEKTAEFIDSLKEKVSTFDEKSGESVKVENTIKTIRSDIRHLEKQQKEKESDRTKKAKERKDNREALRELVDQRMAILPENVSTEEKRNILRQDLAYAFQEIETAQKEVNQLNTEKSTAQKEKKNTEKELSNHQQNFSKYSKSLEKEIATTNFQTRQEIEEALLDDMDKKELVFIRKDLEKREIGIKTLKKHLEKDQKKLEEEKNFEETYEETKVTKLELNESKDQVLKREGEIMNMFRKDDEIRERNKAVVSEIDLQKKVLGKWEKLRELLGGSKDAFNTYVQRLTLNNLIRLANVHLFKLNRRYSLKMNETYQSPADALNFNLIDHYQTNQSRYVDTSSGGEKFLISLALALGLSDLASKNVHVESLFIDEGFGTLDTNTLETVISTLETLQAQGKMIGVISHVENLKERIPTQIQVIKKRNGVSEVEIN